MNFADAVRSIPELTECLKVGLQALGSNRHKIRVNSTRDLTGSVDIDACLARRYPNALVGITFSAIKTEFTTLKFTKDVQVK